MAETTIFRMDELKVFLDHIAEQRGYNNYDVNVEEKATKAGTLGNISRVLMKGTKKNQETETYGIVVKTPPLELQEEGVPIDIFHKHEIHVYKVFLPAIEKIQRESSIKNDMIIKFPKCYNTHCNSDFLLVLEDLNVQGYKMYDSLKSLDYEHFILVVQYLAKFHALSFATKDKLQNNFHSECLKNSGDRAVFSGDEKYFTDLINTAENIANNHMNSEINKLTLKKYFDVDVKEKLFQYLDYDESKTFPYNTFVHGDMWTNNLLFEYKNGKPTKVVPVDWQMFSYSSPVIDLGYFIMCCLDTDLREKYWNEILNTYYRTLSSYMRLLNCDPDLRYPEKIFRQHVQEKFGYGLYCSILLVPMMLEKDLEKSDTVDVHETDNSIMALSDYCKERLNGIVDCFLKYNMI